MLVELIMIQAYTVQKMNCSTLLKKLFMSNHNKIYIHLIYTDYKMYVVNIF